MSELQVGASLVGTSVAVAGKPEWGVGRVLKVLSTTIAGSPQHRVTIHFPHGTRTLIAPPATLTLPQAEGERAKIGWLDSISGTGPDDRLRTLTPAALQVLGDLPTRLRAVYPLYDFSEEPASLMKWARAQTGVADPLSHWSRDELIVAFGAFCIERDAHLRGLLAKLKQTQGPDALREELETIEEPRRAAVMVAIARPI